ncbi:ABC transporter B family member 25 [Phytophthora cinnamomi]|uniref:ABC transporter B family member 25 n=1 Tax=Phytophthora cinnamomi TaxID=4785 RepID=UPI00355A264D|nr:ABC transporter B family member 25 [Phytophthora cinnamomi]
MPKTFDVSGPRHVKLRGLERTTTMVDGVSATIVHSMFVEGDARALVQLLPLAVMRTFNKHPRMRALQVRADEFTAEIQEPVAVSDVSTMGLLRLRRFSPSDDATPTFDEWQQYAADQCNSGFDRYTKFPFYLSAWVDEQAEQARLMLFSDHYMSDGVSGVVVLNCILQQVALLASEDDALRRSHEVEYPLQPSFYDMWMSKKFLSKGLMKGVISTFGKAIYRSEMKKFKPVLPARDDQKDFVVPPVSNSTTASFAQGDPTCMREGLAKCKNENVTFGGAVVCATLLAFYHAAQAQPNFKPDEPFKITASLDYNMRQRVPEPAEEDQVGAYVGFAPMESLSKVGVNMKTTRFWDLARLAKKEIDGNLEHTMQMAAVPIVLDRRFNNKIDPSFAEALNVRQSQTSDANISNLGRYPYAKEFSLSSKSESKAKLTVTSLHVYNSNPHLSPSAVLYVTSVESLCYSMGHKCEDDAAKALFNAWVAVCEHLGNIGAQDTLTEVLEQLNL